MAVRLGDEAPDFTRETTEGPIAFSRVEGDGLGGAVLAPARLHAGLHDGARRGGRRSSREFDKRNTKVIGLSVDPLDEHERWKDDIRDVTGHALNFPLIADPDRQVANLYDMIHPNASDTATVRSVFVIGPDNKVKLTLTYPAQHRPQLPGAAARDRFAAAHRAHSVATPADWKQGEDVIIVPAVSDEDARKRFPGGFTAKKPYSAVTPRSPSGKQA